MFMPAHRWAGLLLVCVLCVALPPLSPFSAARGDILPVSRDHVPASYKQLEDLPDMAKPRARKALRCGSCKAVAAAFHRELTALSALRRGAVKAVEYADLFDGICGRVKLQYGLQLRNNQPTTKFSDDPSISRMQGGWVAALVEDRCAAILDAYETKMIKNYEAYGDGVQFGAAVCRDWSKLCSEQQFSSDEL